MVFRPEQTEYHSVLPLGELMAQVHERHEFNSWALALAADALTPKQMAVLQEMVDEGKVANLKTAADFLDWQGEVLDSIEHMYGH